MKFAILSGIVALSITGLAPGADPYSFEEKVLTIKTNRYELRWKNGSMVSWKTFLPTERNLTAPETKYTPGQLPNGPSVRPRNIPPPIEYQPWASTALEKAKFNINTNVDYRTTVSFQRTESGARLIYENLGAARDMSWVQEFSVDPVTGDLCIRQRASSPKGNLSGISFGIYNLDANIPLAVPAFPGNGQVWRGDYGLNRILNIGYPRFWSAGVIIGMHPEGGSFGIWSEDRDFMPKYFRNFSDGARRNIGFEASLNYPYDENREIEAFTWRLNTFAGNWTEPATRYREQLRQMHDIQPLAERTPKWMNGLAMIWSTSQGTPEEVEEMKKKIDPTKVVLWDFTGSTNRSGLNMRVPEYVPRDGFIERNRRLRDAGFHIASYYSMSLIDAHAHPTMIRDYGVGLFYDALAREEVTDIKDRRLIYILPGSAKWRQFYADKMKHVFDNYDVDFLYQDVSGTAVGSSGTVDGLNYNQAVAAADAAIHQAVPEAMIGGEYWNEPMIVHESIGLQRSLGWGGEKNRLQMARMDLPHPICSFLFSPFSYYVSYKVPQRDGALWHQDQNINEVIGSLPDWRTSVTDDSPEAEITLLRARLWAEGFKPWFPAQWEEGVASYMRNEAGDLIRYRRKQNQSYCTRENKGGAESLVYGRISGVNRMAWHEPVQIRGWMAYDAQGPIGLNPDRYYCIFPGEPAASALTIDKLPDGVFVESVRKTEDYLLVAFNKPIDKTFQWHIDMTGWEVNADNLNGAGCLLGVRNPPESVASGEELPSEKFTCLTTLGGMQIEKMDFPATKKVRFGDEMLPMIKLLPPPGGKNSEIAIERLLTLPKVKDLGLIFASDRRGGAGDGIHLVVRINGKEIWREVSGTEPAQVEHAVSLGNFAGRTVLLGISVDSGSSGYNLSNDEVSIGRIRIGTVESPSLATEAPKTREVKPASNISEDETYR